MISGVHFESNQEWLIQRMRSLGYSCDTKGICYGVSLMAMQAFLANDFDSFVNRLILIQKIPPDKFAKYFEKIKAKREKIIHQIKMAGETAYGKLTSEQSKCLENEEIFQEKIKALHITLDHLIAEQKILKNDRDSEFNRRSKQLLHSAYIQLAIDNEFLKLSIEERLELDIPNFFEGIVLYQNLGAHEDLFHKDTPTFGQNALRSFSLTMPKVLEKQGDLVKLTNFSGVYDDTSLFEYFDSLYNILLSAQQTLTLVLHSSDHSVCVNFEPNQKKQWLLIDINELKISIERISTNKIAQYINRAFSRNSVTAFTTEVFELMSKQNLTTKLIEQWKYDKTWIDIHVITDRKAEFSDSSGTSWLYLTARINDIEKVKLLLEKGADINASVDGGTTPLMIAVQNHHIKMVELLIENGAAVNVADEDGTTALMLASREDIEIVKLLLEKNADVNAVNNDGITPLATAAMYGSVEIVTLLLKNGANLNPANEAIMPPLRAAAEYGNTGVATLLLNNGADVNAVDEHGVTSLFIAAQNGHIEIVKILLDAKADGNLAFSSKADALMKFAKNNNVEQRMAALIDKKIPQGELSLFFNKKSANKYNCC